jgi:hypothetical protein
MPRLRGPVLIETLLCGFLRTSRRRARVAKAQTRPIRPLAITRVTRGALADVAGDLR